MNHHMQEFLFLSVMILQLFAYGAESNFSVSEDILYEIWERRPDLQKRYPEVSKGDFEGLKKWATLYGWKENRNLAPLVPQGEVPNYEKPFAWIPIKISPTAPETSFIPLIFLGSSFVAGITTTFYLLKKLKKPHNS